MLDYTREAVALCHGKARSDLDSDRTLNLALVRLPEIVGEAAGRVPKAESARHPIPVGPDRGNAESAHPRV